MNDWLTKPFRWWWKWAGPHSPMGPLAAAWFVFMPSFLVAMAIIAPPIIAISEWLFGWWWGLFL